MPGLLPPEIRRLEQCSTTLFSFFQGFRLDQRIGVRELAVDREVALFLSRHGMASALEGYRGFPRSCAISPNGTAVHGVPGERQLCRGDIVTLDIAAQCGGWITDTAWTYLAPGVSRRSRRLWLDSWSAFRSILCTLRRGVSLGEVAAAAGSAAEERGLAVFPQFVGHGIGRELHEAPVIPFGSSAAGPRAAEAHLEAGMIVNIEPVFTHGATDVVLQEDGWSFCTADGMPTSHFELTVHVSDQGVQVLQFGGMPPQDLPSSPPFGDIS